VIIEKPTMFSDPVLVDTRPGRGTMFSPAEKVGGYRSWLDARYEKSQHKEGSVVMYYGLSQKVNQYIHAMVHDRTPVQAVGLYAGQFAMWLETMAEPHATAWVLKHHKGLSAKEQQQLINEITLVEVLA